MSMADNIRDGVQRKKEDISTEQELRDLINTATSKALKQFIQRFDAGEIPIDNVADLIRVIGAYKEINDIDSLMESKAGQAALPELNMRQERVLNEKIEKGKLDLEDDKVDITNMSAEEVSNLFREMDIAQNKENEGAF